MDSEWRPAALRRLAELAPDSEVVSVEVINVKDNEPVIVELYYEDLSQDQLQLMSVREHLLANKDLWYVSTGPAQLMTVREHPTIWQWPWGIYWPSTAHDCRGTSNYLTMTLGYLLAQHSSWLSGNIQLSENDLGVSTGPTQLMSVGEHPTIWQWPLGYLLAQHSSWLSGNTQLSDNDPGGIYWPSIAYDCQGTPNYLTMTPGVSTGPAQLVSFGEHPTVWQWQSPPPL